jgi:hypothetical protein
VAGTSETVARTRIAVQELVARLDLPTVVRDAAGADEELLNGNRSAAMVNAYVDLRSLSAPRVIVADGASGEVLERRTLPAASTTETAVEAVAHVLYMTVESVLRTQEAEPPVRALPPPAPPPEPVATSPAQDTPPHGSRGASRNGASWGASAGVFATAASFGPSRLLAGAGASLEVAARALAVRPGALASFALYAPGEVTREGATGTFQSMGVRLVPFVEWAPADRLLLQVGAGIGADFVRFDPERPPPGAEALGSLRSTDFILTTHLGAKLGLTESVALVAAFGVDVDTSPRRYVAEYGPLRTSVFELSSVRPQGVVGLAFSLAGTPMFARRTR